MDINSYTIWDDYVNHLKSVDASGNYAEGQKITAIRKMFQRGVTNPMNLIETLWKDYVEFENSINIDSFILNNKTLIKDDTAYEYQMQILAYFGYFIKISYTTYSPITCCN